MAEPVIDDNSRRERRAILLKLNTDAWNGRSAVNSDNQAALLKEISTLSLEKYLSEIIGAAAEGVAKCRLSSDIWAAVEVTSALHQRFGKSFTETLMLYLLRGFGARNTAYLSTLTPEQRDKEEASRIARQRGLLRLLTEYWFCGIARTTEDARLAAENVADTKAQTRKSVNTALQRDVAKEPVPLEVLRELLGTDTRDYAYLPLASAFVKYFGAEILGTVKKKGKRQELNEDGTAAATGEDTAAVASSESYEGVMTPQLRQRFREVLESYYAKLSAYLVKQHRSIKEQERKNNAAYVRSGEIFEDRQANFERMVRTEEKMIANAQIIADALQKELPDLADEEDKDSAAQGASFSFTKGGVSSTEDFNNAGIWEDEDQKKFYEDIIDLRLRVPQEFFDAAKSKDGEKSENRSPSRERNEDIVVDDEADEYPVLDDNEEANVIPNQSIGAQVDLIIHRLQEMTSREVVDQVAIDFCFLNSKASRNRLVRALQSVPTTRHDLIPMYSRLIATLNRYIPEIGVIMTAYLQREFGSLLRKKAGSGSGGVPERSVLEARARNIRYIAELVKFKVVPNHVTFNCIKLLLDGFSRYEIETLCNFLESCGRFLIRTEATQESMNQMLQILWKKKTAQNLDARERILIENAFYFVNPPERSAIVQKERSVIEQYVRKLVYVDLNARSYPHVLKQFRKLRWDDPETIKVIDKTFAKIWKVKYSNIHLMALIAGWLMKYHQDFIVRLADTVLESIRVGLELNMFKYNQQRVAQVKFLGEMYIYKIVDSSTIFDTLYTIVGYGHEGGRPQPGKFTALDPVDDYFRIRLVCIMLETCGHCFDRGSAKKKLDLFLAFFQYYIYTKLVPLPMEVEFNVHDMLQAVRPNMKVCMNLEEAANALAEAMTSAFGDMSTNTAEQEREEEEDEPEVEDDDDDDDEEEETAAEVLSSESESVSSDGEVEYEEAEDSGRGRDPVVDEEFDREFSKMLAESLESRKFERRATFDVPLPMLRSQQYSVVDMTGRGGADEKEREVSPPKRNMQFRLLTKRGNRQQIHTVEVPMDSAIAVSTRVKQKAEQEERQRIRNLVLDYERSGST